VRTVEQAGGFIAVASIFIINNERGVVPDTPATSPAGRKKHHLRRRGGKRVNEAHCLRFETVGVQGSEDLRQPFRQVNQAEQSSLFEERSGSPAEILERQGNLLPRQRAAVIGADPPRTRGSEGGVGYYPVKGALAEKSHTLPGVTFDNGAAVGKTVPQNVVGGLAGKLGLKLDTGHFNGKAATGQEKGNNAAARTDIDDTLALFRCDKRDEEKGIESVPVAVGGLGNLEVPYPFDGFFSTVRRYFSGGSGSVSHSPGQYLPVVPSSPAPASGLKCSNSVSRSADMSLSMAWRLRV
jgi:hypothetical protein